MVRRQIGAIMQARLDHLTGQLTEPCKRYHLWGRRQNRSMYSVMLTGAQFVQETIRTSQLTTVYYLLPYSNSYVQYKELKLN
jgi:hypothetical protein